MYQKHGAYFFVGKGNKWTPLGRDYAEALTKYATLQETQHTTTIDGLINRYCNEVLPKRAEDTRITRRKEFKTVRAVFGHMPPGDLEVGDVWDFYLKRGENQAALHEVRALSVVLSWGVKWRALPANPLIGVKFAEGPKFQPRDRYVTDDEFLKVRDVASPMIRVAMNIALITAARQRDIRLLTRAQVAEGFLQTRQSKTGKRVNYPIAGSLDENIKLALSIGPQVRQYVIVGRTGKPYTLGGFQTQWKRAMAKAFPNVADRFTYHDLRAKSLSDADSLELARERAGHADARTTKRIYRRKPEVATVMDITQLKRKEA